jgi:hypothetical protein
MTNGCHDSCYYTPTMIAPNCQELDSNSLMAFKNKINQQWPKSQPSICLQCIKMEFIRWETWWGWWNLFHVISYVQKYLVVILQLNFREKNLVVGWKGVPHKMKRA